jgi:tRNA nucleotidyltransferase (CCA-adding enzyme)
MGFTGYSLELAVIMTGGLDSAIAAIRGLEDSPLDPLRRPLETLRAMPQFRDDYVFIIDPTDTRRNVASSFTQRSCRWLSHRIDEMAEKAYSGQADVADFFVEKPVPVEQLPKQVVAHALAFEFISDESVHYTVLRDKLYRLAAKIESDLGQEKNGERRFGRALTEVYFEGGRFALGILVERHTIPRTYPRRGPSTSLDGPCDEFRKAHPDAFEKDSHLWVNEERQWTSAPALSRAIVEEHKVRGLTLSSRPTDVSKRVLFVLYRYVMPLEAAFSLENKEEFKQAKAGLDR